MLHFVTVTKQSVEPTPTESKRCAWCSRSLPERPPHQSGRRPKYCRRSCRQRAYEARRRSDELGLGDDELVITRNELDDANDRLFEIRQLIAEATRDLDDGVRPATVARRLIEAADGVVGSN